MLPSGVITAASPSVVRDLYLRSSLERKGSQREGIPWFPEGFSTGSWKSCLLWDPHKDHYEEPTGEPHRVMRTNFETHESCGRQRVTASSSDTQRKLGGCKGVLSNSAWSNEGLFHGTFCF